jgi:hypothetical protein
MDAATRQAIVHIYIVIWGCIALRFLRNHLFEAFPAIGSWVNKLRATNRDNKQFCSELTMVGAHPQTSMLFGVCDSSCGIQTNLVDLREFKREIFPRSCEHCYGCGKLLPGTYERGCVIHYDPTAKLRFYCPEWDFGSTELFLETLQIVGSKVTISDFIWKYTHQLAEEHPEASPEGLATIIFATPENYGE